MFGDFQAVESMQAKGLTNDPRYNQLCYLLQQAEQKEQRVNKIIITIR